MASGLRRRQCLASRMRLTDFIARYAGEEFVMNLAGITTPDALKLTEQLRKGDGLEDAFERADAALYRAKSGGRNRRVTG